MQFQTGSAIVTAALCLLFVADAGAQVPSAAGVTASEARGRAMDTDTSTGVPLITASPRVHDSGADSLEARVRVQGQGPTTSGAAVGVRAIVTAEASRPDLAVVQQAPNVGRSKALMIVGGAALIAGLLIGDDAGALLAVGGAVVGLYGLYQFVR